MTRQRGFTMIEVLVACAVIVILMGLLFVGGRAIINNQKKNTTKAALSNLKAMVSGREAAVGVSQAKTQFDALFNAAPMSGTPLALNGDVIGNLGDKPIAAPPPKNTTLPRVPRTDNHVGRTQNVITQLSAVPANKAALAKMPNEQLLEASTLAHGEAPSGGIDHTVGAVLLDGWDIPILAVPSIGVRLYYEADGSTARLIKSPDGKPFFMSAGPDGFFSFIDSNHNGVRDAGEAAAGDDNVYSFEN